MKKWDKRFIDLAEHISTWSKDPSTKVGAVIVDRNRRIISVGYNGFPAGVVDCAERYENREMKYEMIVHAEENAILFANRSLDNCTLYTWPFQPCSRCAAKIAQTGIGRIVAPLSVDERWKYSFNLAQTIFNESGINLELI